MKKIEITGRSSIFLINFLHFLFSFNFLFSFFFFSTKNMKMILIYTHNYNIRDRPMFLNFFSATFSISLQMPKHDQPLAMRHPRLVRATIYIRF